MSKVVTAMAFMAWAYRLPFFGIQHLIKLIDTKPGGKFLKKQYFNKKHCSIKM